MKHFLLNPIVIISYALLITLCLFFLDKFDLFNYSNYAGIKVLVNFLIITIVGFFFKRSIEIRHEEVSFYERAVKNYNSYKLVRRKLKAQPFKFIAFSTLIELLYEFEKIQLEFEGIRDYFKINKSILWNKNRISITMILEEIESDLRNHTKYLEKEQINKWKGEEDKEVFQEFYSRMTRKSSDIEFLNYWNLFQKLAYNLSK